MSSMNLNNTQQVITYGGGNQQTANANYVPSSQHYGYGRPINPYTGYPMDKASFDKCCMEYALKIEEARCKNALEIEKERSIFEMRKNLEDKKTENALRREEGAERRRKNRELASYAVFENSEGYLCMEVQYADGERVYSKPIINCTRMRAYRVCDLDSHETAVCIIGFDDFVDRIVLHGKSLSAEGLAKSLEKKGVSIMASRERRKMAVEMIFSYLMAHATVTSLPDSLGWHQTRDGWLFAGNESQTIAGAMKGEVEHV